MPRFQIRFYRKVINFDGSALAAAKRVSKLASDIHTTMPLGVLPSQATLMDEHGKTLMSCSPHATVSVQAARRGLRAKRAFAKCTIKPAFKKTLRRR